MIEMKLGQVRPYALIFVELSTAIGCLVAVEREQIVLYRWIATAAHAR